MTRYTTHVVSLVPVVRIGEYYGRLDDGRLVVFNACTGWELVKNVRAFVACRKQAIRKARGLLRSGVGNMFDMRSADLAPVGR